MTESDFKELHEKLVQTVADFLKDKGVPKDSWMLSFTVDDINSLIEYGEWTPYNDSYLGITNSNGEELLWRM